MEKPETIKEFNDKIDNKNFVSYISIDLQLKTAILEQLMIIASALKKNYGG